MATSGQLRLARIAETATRKSSDPSRHKCFVSYHTDDEDEVAAFLEGFGEVFIPRVIGLSEEADFIGSEDDDYVMDSIREAYLTDSTVTIVLVGNCTWSRRFIDWEIKSTLRNDKNNRRSGLLAVTLPSAASNENRRLPDRVRANVAGADGDEGYARWWVYPTNKERLRAWIETAYAYRTERESLIQNGAPRKMRNGSC